MRNPRSFVSLTVLAAAACSGGQDSIDAAVVVVADAAPDAPPDGPTYDFSCFGATPPTTAANTVTLSGTIHELTYDANAGSLGLTPLAGATVDTCPASSVACNAGDRLDQQTPTPSDGSFTTAAISTGTSFHPPLDAYVKGTKTAYRPTYAYPPMPFIADQPMIPLVTILSSTFDFAISLGLLGVTQTAGNGMIGVAVTDCGLTPVVGAVVSVKQGGNEVSQTNALDGAAFGQGGGEVRFDVPPGDTVVSASFMGMNFPPHTVRVYADSTTYTGVIPGPL
jgi:hypothetical protein